ncbi:hypothetical protein OESDEN_19159, partial [Oesophagostomum dentatum]
LSPPSLVVSFVAVISFHESFITKLDRAYHIQCAYTESNKSISTQLDVGMTAPTDLNSTATPPVCAYQISSVDGKPIQNVRVGDRVKHEWSCTTTSPGTFSLCFFTQFRCKSSTTTLSSTSLCKANSLYPDCSAILENLGRYAAALRRFSHI